MELLRHIGRGDPVTLVAVSKMLTTQQAAYILNVSRPFLISRFNKEELPHSCVGRHRRIKAGELFKYKESRNSKRAEALSVLADSDAELIGRVCEQIHYLHGLLLAGSGVKPERSAIPR
jgi:excisionase family DNA binding protein